MTQHPDTAPNAAVTPRQREYIEAIIEWHQRNGRPPAIVDLARRFNISKQGAAYAIATLARKGLLRLVGRAPHQIIELLDDTGSQLLPGTVPLLGRVTAGLPILAVENRIGQLRIDPRLLRRGAAFALRVKGDSMVDAGILDGDEVIIRPQETADAGQIVLALLGEEATIKRLRFGTDGTIILHPENSLYRDIVVDPAECRIQGVVLGLYRELEA